MLGLFGTLTLAHRSLQAHRQAAEVTGHNLANVNNPAYARQRVLLRTAPTVTDYQLGQQGTGVDAVAITQIRHALLDRQIQTETSVRGSLEARRSALQLAQAAVGQQIDRGASGATGTAAAGGAGAQRALADNLSEFFNGFQSLSNSPTSIAERQVLLIRVQDLTTQFRQVASRLDQLRESLNTQLDTDLATVNERLQQIATLNQQITTAELGSDTQANDLRDLRQQKLEELATLVRVEATPQPDGSLNLALGGQELVRGQVLVERLELYDAGQGQLLVRTRDSAQPLTLTGGALHGTIEVRDGELAAQRADLDLLAARLIQEVNDLHAPGYGLHGTTGEPFFLGTNATTIQINPTLANDPARIQAAHAPNAVGNNQVALAIAQLADRRLDALGQQTFHERYSQSVARLGEALASAEGQLADQQIVEQMLLAQRESVSGVSLDEEMTDLIRFQKAFDASARLLTTIDEMLETVLNLKR